MPLTVQICGHSFIKHMKTYIRDAPNFDYQFSLDARDFMIQTMFSGSYVKNIVDNIELISTFEPQVVFLLVGANELSDPAMSTNDIVSSIKQTVHYLHYECKVQMIFVCQAIYRLPSQINTRYSVNVSWYNTRVDAFNMDLEGTFHNCCYTKVWRLKGFVAGWFTPRKRRTAETVP